MRVLNKIKEIDKCGYHEYVVFFDQLIKDKIINLDKINNLNE